MLARRAHAASRHDLLVPLAPCGVGTYLSFGVATARHATPGRGEDDYAKAGTGDI